MTYEISSSILPDGDELKQLFTQTTWASYRTDQDINRMLLSLKTFVTIRVDQKLIGFGRAITDGIYRALIDDIIVDSAYRNKGLGREIMQQLIDQLVDVEEVFLNTKPDMEAFYEQFGFKLFSGITMKKIAKNL